jgi:hypothetical protein
MAPIQKATSEQLARELSQALRSDRTEVLEPLLRRMLAVSEELDRGRPVPSPVVRDALRLLRSYHTHLQHPRIVQLERLFGLELPESVRGSLTQVAVEPERASRRWHVALAMLTEYERALPSSARHLAGELRALTRSELAWQASTEELADLLLRSPRLLSAHVQEAESVASSARRSPSSHDIERLRMETHVDSTRRILAGLAGGPDLLTARRVPRAVPFG